MAIKKDAVLHKEGVKIVGPEGLSPGDFVSLLPGLWSNIGLVCNIRNTPSIIILDAQFERQNGLFKNLHSLEELGVTSYAIIPGTTVVPLLRSDTFDVSNPGRNGIALIGERLACIGWSRSSYILIDAEKGIEIRRDQVYPTYINSWDLMTKDVDDEIVSLLEVRPD